MIEKTGVDGIMIGRGSYGAPWFLSQVIEYLHTGKITFNPTIPEKKEIMLAHIKSMLEYYGPKAGILNARKHISWYSKGITNSNEFRRLINNTTSIDEVLDLVENLFK
jgi:tRNA-dihydrouridine synthase B